MHEYSIVNALLDLCEKNCASYPDAKVSTITVAVGKLSGVEPTLLATAFDTFKEGTCVAQAAMVVDLIEPAILCHACHQESIVHDGGMLCPACQSDDTILIRGEELHLMRMELA